MKVKMIIFFGLFLFTQCNQKKNDSIILEKVLADYCEGIRTFDLNKLNALTTKDFVFFENGKIWTNDSLVKSKDKFKSIVGEWKFDNVKVTIDNSSGYMIYYNRSNFIVNDTLSWTFDRLESATFKKIDGIWKLNSLHSTIKK
ncbi:MAG: nuclear transport factor 2 family protein [Cyclobacteriaceae bacterium]|nr:nuclear transport factor 2 family protein [Cyclobacteriaceae bacterium]